MITTIRPLSEMIKNIKLVDDDNTGLIVDVEAAAKNRANIERMREKENNRPNSDWFYCLPTMPAPDGPAVIEGLEGGGRVRSLASCPPKP